MLDGMLPATLRLGPVHLTVADVDRSAGFYQDAIGLGVQSREDGTAALGAGGEPLLVLHEVPGARPAGRSAGLFHYALLFPTREELARALQRLAATPTPISGASDHGVSEALYLSDPDGNGIELYADRPRDAWPPPTEPGARVGMFTRPLDLDDLLGLVAAEPPVPRAGAGLVMGHVHLHVGDLAAAQAFYRDRLGLELMTTYPGALFLSAGGYHHHLGVNTWAGEGVGPAPAGTAGLREWTLVLEEDDAAAAARERIGADAGGLAADPWGTGLRVLGRP
jgi:catechol 2,3-dioxygenase